MEEKWDFEDTTNKRHNLTTLLKNLNISVKFVLAKSSFIQNLPESKVKQGKCGNTEFFEQKIEV